MSSFQDDITFFPSRQGALTGQMNGISLASRHDPLKEAARQASARDETAGSVLFLGLGMAYQVEAYLKASGDIPLIIVEKSEELFRRLSEERDLSGLLTSERVNIFLDIEPERLTPYLKDHNICDVEFVPHRALYAKDRDYYDQVATVVNRWQDRHDINMNTLNRFGRLWIRNLAANLPLLAQASPVSRLKDRFTGMPALLVAAGPSLEPLLSIMKELSQRMVIIAVDTSYANLLHHGIRSDILVVTDPQYWNTRHLDFCDYKDTLVVSDTSSHPRVLRNFTGPLFLSKSPFPLAELVEEDILDISLKSGGSVATAAWDLAGIMGCSGIYCAGLDLGFPGKQTHCRGSFFEERVNYLSTRISGPEQWSWHALHSAPLHIGRNYRGDPLLSDQRMKVYISWFTEQMEKKPGTTWNLSRRGSFIPGMDFKETRDLLRIPIIRSEVDEIKEDLSRGDYSRQERALREKTTGLINSIKEALIPVEKALELSYRLREAFVKQEDLSGYLKELDILDTRIAGESAKEIGGFLIQPHIKAMQKNPPRGAAGIIENSITLYDQLARSLSYHRDIFELYSRSATRE